MMITAPVICALSMKLSPDLVHHEIASWNRMLIEDAAFMRISLAQI